MSDEKFAGANAERARRTRRSGFDALFPPGDTTFVEGDQFATGRDSYQAEHITINHHPAGAGVPGTALAAASMPWSEVEQVLRRHVLTASDPALRARVREALRPEPDQSARTGDRLTVLRGSRDSGRLHSAVAALGKALARPDGEEAAAGASAVVRLSSVSNLRHLARGLDYRPGHGYVLDATGQPWVRNAEAALVAALHERIPPGACLVIVVDDHSPAPSWGMCVLDHRAPDCSEVVMSHLADLLREDGDDADPATVLKEATRFATVADARDTTRHAWDAAALAGAVADWQRRRATDTRAEPAVQAYRRREVMARARDLLRLAGPAEAPRAQAFILAGAVLDGEALSDVVDAAHLLSHRLAIRQDPENVPPRVIFGDPLQRWLHHVDVLEAAPADAEPVVLSGHAPDAGRPGRRGRTVVRLREPTLAGAVLDVVWGEYDEARDPLLWWLQMLCRWPEDTVRARAALAVGRIATLDFEHVERAVLERWAQSQDIGEQRAAAWALEGIVERGVAQGKVLRLLRKWSRSASREQRTVAARAYGTSIGARHFAEARDGILAAFREEPGLAPVVRLAMVEIYASGAPREVVAELARWSLTSPRLRVAAATCFLDLADLRAEVRREGPGPAMPDLAERAREDASMRSQVVDLWFTALKLRGTQNRAWRLLRTWRDAGQTHPVTAAILGEVTRKLRRTPVLDQRLAFYEAVWRSSPEPAGAPDAG